MQSYQRLLLGGLGLAVLIGGCTAAAHLLALQPPTLSVKPTPSPRAAAAPGAAIPRARAFQRGIDIDAYTYPGQDVAAAAAADVAFVKGLHGNAVSISFPFFMAGPLSSQVSRRRTTPSPQQLAMIISAARRAGLYVSVRPLLDEGSLGRSRTGWMPARPHLWFRSYTGFLRPYARAAARAGANEFIVGSEFVKFGSAPEWAGLDTAIHHLFPGTLACANNWSRVPVTLTGNCGPVTESVDAYPPGHRPLLASWMTYDATLAPGTVLTEVDIAAAPGAFAAPYQYSWPGQPLTSSVQARWFTAACRAAVASHLGGIYFWSIGLSAHPAVGPTPVNPLSWAGAAGAPAIARCFKAAQ